MYSTLFSVTLLEIGKQSLCSARTVSKNTDFLVCAVLSPDILCLPTSPSTQISGSFISFTNESSRGCDSYRLQALRAHKFRTLQEAWQMAHIRHTDLRDCWRATLPSGAALQRCSCMMTKGLCRDPSTRSLNMMQRGTLQRKLQKQCKWASLVQSPKFTILTVNFISLLSFPFCVTSDPFLLPCWNLSHFTAFLINIHDLY